MSICWHCRKQIPDAVKICPHCRADQTTPGQRPKVARRLEDLRRAQPVGFMVMGEAARGGRRGSRRIIGLIALVAAIAITIWALLPSRFDSARLEAFDEAPCVQYDRCVVVYLAPWSPATLRTLGAMAQLQAILGEADVGLGVVVAADDDAEVDALTAALPVGGWIDRDDLLPDQLDIETVPTWLLVDGTGKVLKRVDGTYLPVSYHLSKLGL